MLCFDTVCVTYGQDHAVTGWGISKPFETSATVHMNENPDVVRKSKCTPADILKPANLSQHDPVDTLTTRILELLQCAKAHAPHDLS